MSNVRSLRSLLLLRRNSCISRRSSPRRVRWVRWVRLNERGGAHVLMFALLAVVFSVLLTVTSLEWLLLSVNKTKTKLALDRATHAASLMIDPLEAAYGRLAWDEIEGERQFYRLLRLNLRLSEEGAPTEGSYLPTSPVVHSLEFVDFPVYPSVLRRTVVVDEGERTETTRNVEVTVYGPSVVAIVEVRHSLREGLEPVVLSSVSSVRFR